MLVLTSRVTTSLDSTALVQSLVSMATHMSAIRNGSAGDGGRGGQKSSLHGDRWCMDSLKGNERVPAKRVKRWSAGEGPNKERRKARGPELTRGNKQNEAANPREEERRRKEEREEKRKREKKEEDKRTGGGGAQKREEMNPTKSPWAGPDWPIGRGLAPGSGTAAC